jgi:hypothetical protein
LCFYFGHSSLCSYFQVPSYALVLKLLLILWVGIGTSMRWSYYLTFQGKLIFFQFDQKKFILFFICVCVVFCFYFVVILSLWKIMSIRTTPSYN